MPVERDRLMMLLIVGRRKKDIYRPTILSCLLHCCIRHLRTQTAMCSSVVNNSKICVWLDLRTNKNTAYIVDK